MDVKGSRLKQNMARIRRDIRITACEMQTLIDADLDYTGAARIRKLRCLYETLPRPADDCK